MLHTLGNNPGNRIDPTGLASLGAWAYPAASGASTYPAAPQSTLSGTPLPSMGSIQSTVSASANAAMLTVGVGGSVPMLGQATLGFTQ